MATTAPPMMMNEPSIALPTARLLGASVGVSLGVGAVWMLFGSFNSTVGGPLPGLYCGLLVAAVSTLGVLILMPWKPKPISTLGTLWLAGTVVRLFVTPLLAWVLYSASTFNATFFTLAVGSIYFASLMGEVLVLAVAVRSQDGVLLEQTA